MGLWGERNGEEGVTWSLLAGLCAARVCGLSCNAGRRASFSVFVHRTVPCVLCARPMGMGFKHQLSRPCPCALPRPSGCSCCAEAGFWEVRLSHVSWDDP